MEIKQPNDIFAAVINKPDLNVFDLAKSDIIPTNTQLLDKSEYKDSAKVQDMFKTEDNKFDENAFNLAYQKSAALFNELSNDKLLSHALEYDPYDFTSPKNAKNIDITPLITKDLNPFKNLYSRSGINSVDAGDLSLRELAQQNKIFDVKENKWLDKSANDFGLFGSLTGPSLVYAQWDEDGEDIDPVTGRNSKHKKGDWKINKDGNLYIETLGDREIYGKQIVNPMDLITTDGSEFNKLDFFDSDGRDKSVVGTTMKLATQIAPYLIPGFNIGYGGFSMALGLSSVLPTFYKAAEGLLLGDNNKGNETDLWKAMNAAQGFLSKYTANSISDASSQSMWNYEQMGEMVSQVFSQIYEQRAAASLSELFYKSNEVNYLNKLSGKADDVLQEEYWSDLIKGITRSKEQYDKIAEAALGKIQSVSEINSKRSKLAKSLNLGYMAMTQSADTYSDALSSGYDNRTAGFAALLAATGQYVLMSNNRMGDWFLDKTTGYTEEVNRAGIRKVVKDLSEDISKGVKILDTNKDAGKKALGNVFVRAKNSFKELLTVPTVLGESQLAENLLKHSLIEGVEEVTEQFAIDAAKGVVDIMGSLGFTKKQGSFGGFSNVFSKQGFETYLSNLVGGMIGGPMFELERSVITPLIKTGKLLPTQTEYDIFHLVANGHAEDLYKEFDKQKSKFGSTDLSPIVTNIDGKYLYLTKDGMSQADVISNVGKEYVKNLDKVLNLENLKQDDDSVIRKAIVDEIKIQDLKEHNTDTFVLSDFTQLAQEIVDLRNTLDSIDEKSPDSIENKSTTNSKLKEKRDKVDDLLTGKKSEYYHGLSLFVLNKNFHNAFISLSVDDYVKDKYDKDYYSLTESEQKEYSTEFKDIMDDSKGDFKNKIKLMFDQYLIKNAELSPAIADFNKDGYAQIRSAFLSKFRDKGKGMNLTDIYQDYKLLQFLNTTIDKSGFKTTSLDSNTDISFGTFLSDLGLIDIGVSSKQREEIISKRNDEILKYLNINKEDTESDEDFELRKQTIIKSIESGQIEDPNLKAISNKYKEELNKKSNISELSESDKVNIISNIDNLGIPTSTLDYNSIQNILNLWNNSKDSKILKLVGDKAAISQVTGASEDIISQLNGIQSEIDAIYNLGNIHIAGFEKVAVSKSKIDEKILRQTNKIIENIAELENVETNMISVNDLMDLLDTEWGDNGDNLDDSAKSFVDQLTEYVNNIEGDEINTDKLIKEFENIITNIKSKISINEHNSDSDFEENYDANVHSENDYYNYIKGNKKISPKRSLLIKYGNEVTELDNEGAKELIEESNNIISDIKNSSTNDLIIAHNIDLENYPEFQKGVYPELDKALINHGYLDYLQIKNILETKPKKMNTVLDKLNEIQINLWGKTGPVSMFSLLKDNLDAFNNIISPSQFVRNSTQIEQLNKALQTISATRAIISGMLTTNVNGTDLYGMNVSLNLAAEKFENIKGKFDIIDSTTASVINQDLNIIEDKLKYLKQLALNNKGSLIEEQSKIKDSLINSLLKVVTDTSSEVSAVNITLNGKTLINQDDLDKIKLLDSNEKKIIELESIIYTKFHDDPRPIKEKLDEIFSTFIKNEDDIKRLVDGKDTILTKELQVLEKKDWYFYLHSILALDAKEFYINYKNLIKKEVSLSDQKAPFYMQLFVHRQESAYLNNKLGKDIIAHSVEFLQPDIETLKNNIISENPEMSVKDAYKKAVNEAHNFQIAYVFSVLGSAGTGKTTIFGNWTLREILDSLNLGDKVNVYAIAPTEKTLTNLTNNLKVETNVTINQSRNDDFFKNILGDAYEEYVEQIELIKAGKYDELSDDFIKGDGDGAIAIKNSWLNSAIDGKVSNGTNLLFIDEMSQLTTLEWQILNHLAKNGEYYIITLGDNLQNGSILGEESFSMENILTPRSIKLKSTIRGANIHVNDNNISLEEFANNSYRKFILDENIDVFAPTLIYYDKLFLNGHKFTKTLTKDDLLKLDPTKEIAFLTESGNLTAEQKKLINETLNIPENDIKVYGMDVQGEEFDQVVILDPIKKVDSLFQNIRNFYTLLSRAKIATLIVGNDGFIKDFNIKIEHAQYTDAKNFDADAIKPFIEQRLAELEDITKDFTKKSTPTSQKTIINTFTVDINEGTEEDIEKNEDKKDLVTSTKDKNNMLSYSFFNNIGLKSIEENIQLDPDFLDLLISDEISLENLLKNNTGTDLGTILSGINSDSLTGRSIKSILNDYIKLKNTILFNTIDGELEQTYTLYNSTINTSNKLTLKRLDTYSQPYKKLVNNITVTGNQYVVGMNITLNGEKHFITLSVLPNIKNPNVKGAINIDKLQELYDKIDSSLNNEVQIDSAGLINSYMGVQVPKPDNDINYFYNVDEIENEFPGSTISEIKVFRGPEYDSNDILNTDESLDYIKKTMEFYNVTKTNKPLEYYKKFAYRPYVIVSYGDNLQYKKLVILYGNKRSLSDFWSELKIVTEALESDKQSMTSEQYKKSDNQIIKAALSTKYTGWRVLFDFLKYSYTSGKINSVAQTIIDLNGYKNANKGTIQNSWPVEEVINGMVKLLKNTNGVGEFKNLSDDVNIKKIIGDRFNGLVPTKIFNPLFDLYETNKQDSEVNDLFNKFIEEYSSDLSNDIYYNTIIDSMKDGSEDPKFVGLLPELLKKNYQMRYAIESNKLLINIQGVLDQFKVDTDVDNKDVINPDTPADTVPTHLIVNVDGFEHEIKLDSDLKLKLTADEEIKNAKIALNNIWGQFHSENVDSLQSVDDGTGNINLMYDDMSDLIKVNTIFANGFDVIKDNSGVKKIKIKSGSTLSQYISSTNKQNIMNQNNCKFK